MKSNGNASRSNLAISRSVRGALPRIPFENIARAVLGARFELSLVLCGDALATRMNKEYRKKSYKPNVLSFPLGKEEGEIFLNVRCAAREAKAFGVRLDERLALLFVHGCFHLKGLSHGRIMEQQERRTLQRFGFKWHGASTAE